MINGLNLNDTKGTLQTLVTAHNRLERRTQAVSPATQPSDDAPMRHGWLGVVRDQGPDGSGDFQSDDPRYWVERVVTSAEVTDDDVPSVGSVNDVFDALITAGDYVAAVNIAECKYPDGGGQLASTGTTNVLPGRLVRVFSLLGAGTFHYFDAGEGLFRVRLSNESGGVYSVYAWEDEDLEDAIATAKVPQYRPFGTSIDFTQYGETGISYYDTSGTLVLVLAIEERYDLGPCP